MARRRYPKAKPYPLIGKPAKRPARDLMLGLPPPKLTKIRARQLAADGLLSLTRLNDLMKHHSLRQVDLAWLCGVTIRTVNMWANGRAPIPQHVSVILQAFHENKLPMPWLIKKLGTTPPYRSVDYGEGD